MTVLPDRSIRLPEWAGEALLELARSVEDQTEVEACAVDELVDALDMKGTP